MDLQMLSTVTKGLNPLGGLLESYGEYQYHKGQAKLLNVEAKSVIQSGNFQADRMREQGNRFIAKQRSGYAKSGVRLEGSPIEALMTSERNLSLDILMTRLNATNQANRIGFSALQEKLAASHSKIKMYQGGTSSILNLTGMFGGSMDMGGGGVSQFGNTYGSNTPQGVYDMGTYSRLPGK